MPLEQPLQHQVPSIYRDFRGASVDDDETRKTKPTTSLLTRSFMKKKLCILLHGLTDDESTWEFDKSSKATTAASGDYGSFLQRDFWRITFICSIQYQSTHFDQWALMNQLMASIGCLGNGNDDGDNNNDYACEIMFVCHSMGGL
jgi:hypothetical protein